MEEKYLPVGTVCLLKGGKKKVMIVGFAIVPNDNKDIVYDYMGAMYPEGIISTDQTLVFNHEQIETIYSKGYVDDEGVSFNNTLKDYLAKSNLKHAEVTLPNDSNNIVSSEGSLNTEQSVLTQNSSDSNSVSTQPMATKQPIPVEPLFETEEKSVNNVAQSVSTADQPSPIQNVQPATPIPDLKFEDV